MPRAAKPAVPTTRAETGTTLQRRNISGWAESRARTANTPMPPAQTKRATDVGSRFGSRSVQPQKIAVAETERLTVSSTPPYNRG